MLKSIFPEQFRVTALARSSLAKNRLVAKNSLEAKKRSNIQQVNG